MRGSTHQRVYLDHNATSPLRPSARRAMDEVRAGAGGNPSSVHAEGRAARAALERGREQVARAVGARPTDLVLTGSATEANNLALKGLALRHLGGPRRRVLVSAVEHPSVLAPARWLADGPLGLEVEVVPVDAAGRVDPAEVEARLGDDVLLVSVVAANNETGVLAPVAEIAEAARSVGAHLHVDAAQALGRVPVDVGAWGVDMLTISSHKVGGPSGAGALWTRSGLAPTPLLHGGHQERNRRGGTEDVSAAAGFGAACEEATRDLEAEAGRMARLRDRLWASLRDGVGDVRRVGDPERCLPNTLNLLFEGAEGEALLFGLDLAGVACSSGSACTAGSLDPSHVLLAMGLDEDLARSAVRFSVGWDTTEEDVDRAAAVLPGLVARAREVAV
ncbi:MAG: cysteine desulfurase family protein [Myxococcota bacterium]